jgi:hypothetical protein
MATLYSDFGRIRLSSDGQVERKLATLRTQLADAEHTLVSHRQRLTALGQSVLDTTMDLAGSSVLTENSRC